MRKITFSIIIFILFVSLGIFGLQKDNIAVGASATIEFKDSPYMIFTVSLDKEKYVVGETATARIRVNADNFDYRGVVTIAGKQYTFFNKEQFYANQIWSYSTSVETTPGNYNADFAITKYTYILGIKFQNTKHASIPYEVYAVSKPPTASISADSTNIPYNTATTIRWSSTNATACSVFPNNWTGTSGAESTGNLTSSQSYFVGCCNATNDCVTDSVMVNVGAPPATPAAHIVLSPTAFTFTGISGGATPPGQTLNIKNTGGESVYWASATTRSWCHASSSGTLAAGAEQNITVSVDAPSNIGTFYCDINVFNYGADVPKETASVTYIVSAAFACSGPSGYTKCADEGGTCSFSGSANVAYGCNSSFYYKDATASIGCNSAAFGGDPLEGVLKACFYKSIVQPTPKYKCSGSSCVQDVNGTYTTSNCNNACVPTCTPSCGSWSSCSASCTQEHTCTRADCSTYVESQSCTGGACIPPPVCTSWNYCASENQFCSFAGTSQARYGVFGVYAYGTYTNGVWCNNATFGDPFPFFVKHCDYCAPPLTACNSGPSGYTKCADEGGTCSFSGSANVAYGCNSSFYYKDATTSIGCNSAAFGGDPLEGVLKACFYKTIVQPTCTPSCDNCSVSCGGGTQTCTRADCSTYSQSCNTQACLPGNFNLNLGGSVACNSVPLSWTSSSGADAYKILRGSPRVNISPYQPYTALNFTDTTVSQNATYPYQIEAYNASGTNRSNEISVTTPYCPPTVNLSANPASIYQGQSSTLIWSSAYSTSCTASGKWSGPKATNNSIGEVVIPSPPPSATYNLTCSGPGGSTMQSVTINISPLLLPNWREIIPR